MSVRSFNRFILVYGLLWIMLLTRLTSRSQPTAQRIGRSLFPRVAATKAIRFNLQTCPSQSPFIRQITRLQPIIQRSSLHTYPSIHQTTNMSASPTSLASYLSSLNLTPNHPPIQPKQSPEDKRQYRVITLENGLTCILVSDHETDKAGAGMDVHVGHFSDPNDFPGLAHFLEHMLFLGTKKYPDENSYSSFLNSHGGSSNAYTSTENTNYYFDVNQAHLSEAIDRFAAFFTEPLFTPSCVERELNAVNNENSKNLQVDQWRNFQLLKSTSSPAHAFSKFGTGNLATLRDGPKEKGLDIREELLKFYASHYSSHLMKLCVVGKESLDELEALVRSKFSDIPRRNVERPVFGHEAMTSAELTRLIRVVPIKDTRSLQLLWHLPMEVHHLFHSKPLELLSHCLGHESTGSILSYLKKKNYANGLSAGLKTASTSFTLFACTVDLTETGLANTDEIVEIIYSYLIHVLKASLANTPKKWSEEIYPEVKAVNAMGFQFKSKESPINLVSSLASHLQLYPPAEVLNGPYELTEYQHELISSMVAHFVNPANLRIHMIGKKFKEIIEKDEVKVLQKEKWYGTEYLNEPIPTELLQRLTSPRVIDDLQLPLFNEFIATDFQIKHPLFSEEEIKKKKDYAPMKFDQEIIPNHPLSSVWFKPDKTFGLPKANVLIRFLIPLAYQSPLNTLLSNLFAQLVTDALNEYAYNSAIAGLSYSLYSTQAGLQLSVGGYNQKQLILLEAILKQIRSLNVVGMKKEADFIRLKEQLKRGLLNFVKENPYSHAMFDEVHTLEEQLWSHSEKLGIIDSLTPQQLDAFSQQLLSTGETELFVHGNIAEAEVKQMTQAIQASLAFQPLYASQLPLNRIVKLSPTHSYLRQCKGLNPDDVNSCTLNLYQLGENTVELHAVAELFSHLIKEPLYNQLRTKEQLGYLVWSNLVSIKGVLHFRVIIQSSNAPADYLNYRVEAFLKHYREVELPKQFASDPTFFQTNIRALADKKLEKDKTLSAESTRHWNEITLHRYQFDRVEREVDVLSKLSERELFAFIDRFISIQPAEGESHRAKYNIQYFGNKFVNLPEPTTYESEERVAFANVPVASNEPTKEEVVTTAAAATSTSEEEVTGSSPTPPNVVKEAIFLPKVPVDHRPIEVIEDINAFKRGMPLFPSFQ